MSRDQRTVAFVLVVVMAFGPFIGAAQAYDKNSGVNGESSDDNHDKWIELDEWPNPMERRTDTSAPAMRPGVTSQTGRASSVPGIPGATPGGPEVMEDGQHNKVFLKEGGKEMMR